MSKTGFFRLNGALLALPVLALLGCSGMPAPQPGPPPPGVGVSYKTVHVTIREGETLSHIADRYDVPVRQIARQNAIANPHRVDAGRRLAVRVPVRVSEPPAASPRRQGERPAARRAEGGVIVVRRGDTLSELALANGTSAAALARANGMQASATIYPGQRLVLPGAAPVREPRHAAMQPRPKPAPGAPVPPAAPVAETRPLPPSSGRFAWPASGNVVAQFGKQANGMHNDGINILVPAGTAVRAADAGRVIYAGNQIGGFGNLVIVQHANGFVTAYAHNARVRVRAGDDVTRGQTIAEAGSTGQVDRPQIHFQIRQGKRPVDPMRHLAPQRVAGA